MRQIVCIFFLICFSQGQSQEALKKKIQLIENQEREILIPAYKGDTISLDIVGQNKSKIGQLALYESVNEPLLMIENARKYAHTIIAKKNSLYKLVIQNNSQKPATYLLTYKVSAAGKKIAQLGYRVQKDTTYGYETILVRDRKLLETVSVQTEKFYLNSTSNAFIKGGKNRIVFPVNLPQGTQEWYYVFTASRNEEDIKGTLASFDLASQLTTYIDDNSTLKKSVRSLSPPPGANICDIYVLKTDKNAMKFKGKEDFDYLFDASRENFKSGIVKVSGNAKSYLGIRNPDNLYGIHIGIEIMAIVAKTEKVKETIQIPIITSYQIPYLIE